MISTSWIVPENQPWNVLCGAWHCPGHTRRFVQQRSSPKEAYYRGEAWCRVGGLKYFHPAPPVHSSHYGGWHPMPWLRGQGYSPVGWMDASMSPLLPVARGTRPRPWAWSKTHHSRYSASSAWGPKFCVLPHIRRRRLWSKVNPGTWWDGGTPSLPVYNAPNWTPPPEISGSSPHADEEPRWNETTIVPEHSDQLSVLSGCGHIPPTSTPPLMADVADQCLGFVAKFCWRILTTHLYVSPFLPAENRYRPTILQYSPVFTLVNYAAWFPRRMIENARGFSKKHTQHWTVNLQGRLHLKWQQLGWLSFQSVQTLYCRDWPAFTTQLVR